ncbi:putative transmembrane protein [Rhizobium johnstonii 3841]|uniref:Transmembrane protein n=1 Tax=Rhizobium johnstonii (strain DSM 114642 / LMG 32736 / 3841) TaxID=216596 RepID=Q1ML26_RHIJ3|nr:putative transmembrane protein [Rhizobium johnstonii 3841]
MEIRWEAEMDQRSSLRAVMIAMFLVALFIVGIYAGQHIGLLPRM